MDVYKILRRKVKLFWKEMGTFSIAFNSKILLVKKETERDGKGEGRGSGGKGKGEGKLEFTSIQYTHSLSLLL